MKKSRPKGLTVFVEADMGLAHTRRLLEGVARHATERATGWRLRWSGSFPTKEELARDKVDGAIRFHYQPPLDSHGLPTVWVCSALLSAGEAQVVPDNRAVGAKAAAHFRERMYSHFAYVGIEGGVFSDERLRGFREGLGGVEPRILMLDVLQSPQAGRRRLREAELFLRGLPRRCAVFVANDQTAHWVALVCERAGLRVPEDLALLGVDDDVVLVYAAPVSLSSIYPNSEELGRRAAERLERILEGAPDDGSIERVPPGEVVLRASSDALATDDASVAEAVRLMRAEACRGLSVDQLCRRIGLGRRSFEQRFFRVLGSSPEAEMRRLRLERAQHLLASTRLPISKVAEEAGFADAFYFSAAFRKAVGKSPREWRDASSLRLG
jgi:LacI family transcriptional regulator